MYDDFLAKLTCIVVDKVGDVNGALNKWSAADCELQDEILSAGCLKGTCLVFEVAECDQNLVVPKFKLDVRLMLA